MREMRLHLHRARMREGTEEKRRELTKYINSLTCLATGRTSRYEEITRYLIFTRWTQVDFLRDGCKPRDASPRDTRNMIPIPALYRFKNAAATRECFYDGCNNVQLYWNDKRRLHVAQQMTDLIK